MIAARRIALAALLWAATLAASASSPSDIDGTERRALLERIAATLQARYVFPAVGARTAAALRRAAADRAFDDATDGHVLAARLTDWLRAQTGDKHLRVRHSGSPMPPRVDGEPSPAQRERALQTLRARNFGVARVERLPGNIGLVELQLFAPLDVAAPAITAAMTLVAHADALIVDLRANGGGDPSTVAFMSSYLFDERVHLNDLVWRDGGRIEPFWTRTDVPGPRFGGRKPVWVLTSARSFSGAEEFAYNLQQLGRATVVGETTGGGAHPGDVVELSPHFSIFVPEGRAVNPLTKSNWEGRGVLPDVPVPAGDALPTARRLALQQLHAAAPDGAEREALKALLDAAR